MLASHGEIRIHQLLEELDIPFEEEYTFEDLYVGDHNLLRFDFACKNDDDSLLCLIEYQGIQHYQPRSKFGGRKGLYRQQYCDNLKKQYCLKHNLKLICIPYIDEPKLDCKYLLDRIYG